MLDHCIEAARCPESIRPRSFGNWHIERHDRIPPQHLEWVGWPSMTLLRRMEWSNLHLGGTTVMEDSRRELTKHAPIFLRAKGRVLVTGLGLGCVVRGLLAKPDVEHIDVVEIDPDILRIIGAEFALHPRVTLHCGDARTIDLPGRWDCAWHDLHSFDGDPHLQLMHGKLFIRYAERCDWQGAWHFPGNLAKLLPWNRRAA